MAKKKDPKKVKKAGGKAPVHPVPGGRDKELAKGKPPAMKAPKKKAKKKK